MDALWLVLITTIPASPQRQARASGGARLALSRRCGETRTSVHSSHSAWLWYRRPAAWGVCLALLAPWRFIFLLFASSLAAAQPAGGSFESLGVPIRLGGLMGCIVGPNGKGGEALYFNSLYFIATDVGCLGAGALTLWLHRRGVSVHGARCATFLGCAALSALTLAVSFLPKGWLLLGSVLLVGAGALGVFPIYHAFTQDLSAHHQGKVTGVAGIAAWAPSLAQKFYGRLVDQTGSFDLGFAIAGCFPLLAFAVLWLLWTKPAQGDGPERIRQ